MEKLFLAEQHYFTKAVAKAGITFPISKADAMEKVGNLTVRVDFEEYVPLKSLLERFYPEHYENSVAFCNAYIASSMNAYKEKIGY